MSAIRCLAPVSRQGVVIILLIVTSGCAITSTRVHWERLHGGPQSRILTPGEAVSSLKATVLESPGHVVLRITHDDPVVALDDARSYAKLLRLAAPSKGEYDVIVESRCDPCPVTAILWGVDELPVFVPHLTLLDSCGGEMTTIEGEVWQQDPVWRNQPIKGAWRLHVSEPGPYYLLITSEPHGPTIVGRAGNLVGYYASPIGKIRVGLTKKPERPMAAYWLFRYATISAAMIAASTANAIFQALYGRLPAILPV